MSQAEQPGWGNRLLDALPRADQERLRPHLERVHLELQTVIYEAGAPIPHVYFPVNCVASLITPMDNGPVIEVGTVGREGLVGLPVFLDAGTMPSRALCQMPGDAWRTRAAVVEGEMSRSSPLVRLLHRYTQGLLNQIAQMAACNRTHAIEERCAQWLLMTHDRAGEDQFLLTQQFLAQMLGVRRASVSVTAGRLQRAGLIRYTRGRITVVNRAGLEAASCACYRIVKEEFDRLIQ